MAALLGMHSQVDMLMCLRAGEEAGEGAHSYV